ESQFLINNLKRYGLGDLLIDIVIREDLRENIREEIKHDKDTIIKEEESPVIMGKHIDGEVTKLNNILGETRNIIIEVYIFQKEVVERAGKKGPIFIANLKVSDKTDSYLMKIVKFNEEEFST